MRLFLIPLVFGLSLMCMSAPFLWPLIAQGQGKVTPPKKAELQPWEAWDQYRDQMAQISRQLGVTCTYCHNTRNYRDTSNPRWKVAKKHIEMVDMLNEKYKDTFSQKVDCYMCHKGVAKPDYKEKK